MEDFSTIGKNNNEVFVANTMPLGERADTPELKEELARMEVEARAISQDLQTAFPDVLAENFELARDAVRDRLWNLAKRAHQFAKHYNKENPYRVGAAMLGWKKDARDEKNTRRRWVVMFDANTRLNKDLKGAEDASKLCAEGYIMKRASEGVEKIDTIVQFVVTAGVRSMKDDPMGLKDDISQRSQMTLTPCAVCRARMIELSENENPIISDVDTEIYTRRSDKGNEWIQKYQKLPDLVAFHNLKPYEQKRRFPNVQEVE